MKHAAILIAMAASTVCAQQFEIDALTAPDGEDGDDFGISMAIHDGVIIVGATHHGMYDEGAAYLIDSTTGGMLGKLVVDEKDLLEWFGMGVDIDDARIAVSAPGSSVVYLFDRKTLEQTARLTPQNGGHNDDFGMAVALAGDVLLVGAPRDDEAEDNAGAVYVFDVSTGELIDKLFQEDPYEDAFFGWSIAVSGDLALIGAPGDNFYSLLGFAYLYDLKTLTPLFKYDPQENEPKDAFGRSVAIDGNRALIGAPSADVTANATGAAYLFDVETGDELARYLQDDAESGDAFGTSVTLRGDTALIGASWKDELAENSGAVYLFQSGIQTAKFISSIVDNHTFLGASVGLDGARALVGVPNQESGAVLVFPLCEADVNADGKLDVLDFVVFQLAWVAQEPHADCNDDGAFSIIDFVCFQQRFQADCPPH